MLGNHYTVVLWLYTCKASLGYFTATTLFLHTKSPVLRNENITVFPAFARAINNNMTTANLNGGQN